MTPILLALATFVAPADAAANLTVSSYSVTADLDGYDVAIVIRNNGNAASGGFWVDLVGDERPATVLDDNFLLEKPEAMDDLAAGDTLDAVEDLYYAGRLDALFGDFWYADGEFVAAGVPAGGVKSVLLHYDIPTTLQWFPHALNPGLAASRFWVTVDIDRAVVENDEGDNNYSWNFDDPFAQANLPETVIPAAGNCWRENIPTPADLVALWANQGVALGAAIKTNHCVLMP